MCICEVAVLVTGNGRVKFRVEHEFEVGLFYLEAVLIIMTISIICVYV